MERSLTQVSAVYVTARAEEPYSDSSDPETIALNRANKSSSHSSRLVSGMLQPWPNLSPAEWDDTPEAMALQWD